MPGPWATLSVANCSSLFMPLLCHNYFPTGFITSSLSFLLYLGDHAIFPLLLPHHTEDITLKTITNQDTRVRPGCTRRPCRARPCMALTAPPQCSPCSHQAGLLAAPWACNTCYCTCSPGGLFVFTHGFSLSCIAGSVGQPGSCAVYNLVYFLYDTLLLVPWFPAHGPPPFTLS